MKKDFLQEILERRRKQVAAEFLPNESQRRRRALRAREGKTPHHLRAALSRDGGARIIAEFKRASPSLGEINPQADLARTVALYEAAGACAISVLTEPEYFHGSLADLRQARALTGLPILRKDFIIAESQIEDAAEAGADAILFILAALTDGELLRFRTLAEDELGLDALAEVHTAEEMQRAANCGARLIGVNNRDLRTLTTSLETSIALAERAPNDATLISESGIRTPADIVRLRACGYRGFLIGESLLRAPDPASLLRSLSHV